MKNNSFKILISTFIVATSLSSCKKSEDAVPTEQELITTIKLSLTNKTNSSDVATYTYKIENGFNSSTQGIIRADTLKMQSGYAYTTSIEVLNEKASPVDNTTLEIIKEQTMHLFLFNSVPLTGAGSLSFSDGQKDVDGNPFNLTGSLQAGTMGSGMLNLYLMHAPVNKNGATPAASGGETDVEAHFPVMIR